jgi:hypothetical protein
MYRAEPTGVKVNQGEPIFRKRIEKRVPDVTVICSAAATAMLAPGPTASRFRRLVCGLRCADIFNGRDAHLGGTS